MLDSLISLVGSLGPWGYLLIFLGVALECQAMLGLVMPGESLVLAGGFFAGQGVFDPGGLIVVISIAAILGDSIGYGLGRHLERNWLVKHGSRFGLRQEHLDRGDGLFAKHGGKAVLGSHFLHLLRPLMPLVAGDRRMRYQKFLLFNSLGCIAWASVYGSLGYGAGESWRMAAEWAGFTGKIVLSGLLLAVAVVWLWRWRGRHEADIQQRWQVVAEHPRVVALRRLFWL
jgi:membrane-associated protein